MKIRLNVDKQEYKSKPTNFGTIRNRLCNEQSITEITPEQLIDYVRHGRSFTPAVMTGTTGDTWQEQQLICADIDNVKHTKIDKQDAKIPLDHPLTPQRALEVMAQYGIEPYFMYSSFNNSAELPRYRIVLILDKPLTDPFIAATFTERFTGIFNSAEPYCADTGIADNARLFFGGRADSIIYNSGKTTSAATLQGLPIEWGEEEEPAADQMRLEDIREDQEQKPAKASTAHSTMQELQDKLQADKNNFDLATYIERTTTSRRVMRGRTLYFNPCPVCGHKDDFQVTGSIYHCYSASGGTGGSIIDYLMHREGIDKSAAIEKFKFEIMGYDKQEWRQAYFDERDAQIAAEYERQKAQTASENPAKPTSKEDTAADAKTPQEGTERAKTGQEMLQDFLLSVQSREFEPIPTGIKDLDRALAGGFMRKTLVLLGAAPGMGKTALAQWIFENIARSGQDVLYFNLEMARQQLIARSLSRLCWMYDKKDISALDILRGYSWSDDQRQTIMQAADQYRQEIAEHFTYNPEGVDNKITTILSAMTAAASKAKSQGKSVPIICIDYLQIIDTGERDAVEGMKNTISRLKDFAKDYGTVVFLVIANNRASNKTGTADLESGRDTSALEYSGDMMLGLVYTAIEDHRKYETGEVNKDGSPKLAEYDLDAIRRLKREAFEKGQPAPAVCNEISLKVLKNRFGEAERRANLIFDGKHSTFKQIEKKREDENPFTRNRTYTGKRL